MKVKVKKMNFSKKLQETVSKSIFGSMLQDMGADLKNLPEEQTITLDTKYIVEIDEPLEGELGSGAFTVKLAIANESNPCIYIKNECYDELYNVWIHNDETSVDRAIYS